MEPPQLAVEALGGDLATIKRFCLTTLEIAERQNEITNTAESGH